MCVCIYIQIMYRCVHVESFLFPTLGGTHFEGAYNEDDNMLESILRVPLCSPHKPSTLNPRVKAKFTKFSFLHPRVRDVQMQIYFTLS